MKADNVWTEIVYENLELYVMGIITVYIPLYYCFHKVVWWGFEFGFYCDFGSHENSMSDSDEQLNDDSGVSVGLENFLQSRCILFFMFLSFRWG